MSTRRTWVGVGVLAVALSAAGCGSGHSSVTQAKKQAGTSPSRIAVSGDLLLAVAGDTELSGGGCAGDGGYSDIAAGAAVTVKDASGKIVGVSQLGDGQEQSAAPSYRGACLFDFTVPDVPVGNFYSIEVSHRGQISVTLAQARSGDVHFTLGS